MDWTAAVVAIAFAGLFAFGGMRAVRRLPAERQRRMQRYVWAGAVLVVVVLVGLTLAPDGLARWLVVAIAVGWPLWGVSLAVRRHLGAEFLIQTGIFSVALALWAASNFVSGSASSALFYAGVAVLLVGSRILRWWAATWHRERGG
jgi:hypothetical protein